MLHYSTPAVGTQQKQASKGPRDARYYTHMNIAIARFIGTTAGLAMLHACFLPIKFSQALYQGMMQSSCDGGGAFGEGVYSVIPCERMRPFRRVNEVRLVMSGSSVIDLPDWRANTAYQGGVEDGDVIVEWFWAAMEREAPALLRAIVGSERVMVCHGAFNINSLCSLGDSSVWLRPSR